MIAIIWKFSEKLIEHVDVNDSDSIMNVRNASDFNQSLMELGATVCMPKKHCALSALYNIIVVSMQKCSNNADLLSLHRNMQYRDIEYEHDECNESDSSKNVHENNRVTLSAECNICITHHTVSNTTTSAAPTTASHAVLMLHHMHALLLLLLLLYAIVIRVLRSTHEAKNYMHPDAYAASSQHDNTAS